MPESLRHAMDAIEAGDKTEGERILKLVLQTSPDNEMVWLWLANITDSDEERLAYLNQVLALNPENKWAKRTAKLLQLGNVKKPLTTQVVQSSRITPKLESRQTPEKERLLKAAQPQAGLELSQSKSVIHRPTPINDTLVTEKSTIPLHDSELPNSTKAAPAQHDEHSHQTGAYDVFISYSRKDKPFVQKLYETLLANGQKVWVDWGNIPLSADWRTEIREGIEKANAIIFVISPNFLASKECRVELEIAETFSKRLIPIVFHDVDTQQVPPSLGALNWLFFRHNDNFDDAFQGLQESLDTDLEWVKAHTRLLTKALEWEREDSNRSFLLRGDELKEAETLVAQADKNPGPTPLQKQYILASQEDALKRQRTRMMLVSAGLILSLVLAAIAIVQTRIAQVARNNAQQQAKIALARQLSAQAIIYADDQPDLAVLLSLEAERVVDRAEGSGELLANLRHSPYLVTTLHGHTANVRSVAFNPDGTILASGSKDKTIILWDPGTQQPLGEPLTGHTDRVTQIVFSPDGKILASGSRDNTIRLWDVATGQPIGQPFTGHTGWVNSIAFTPDGSMLISGSSDETIMFWDVATGKSIGRPITGHTAPVNTIAVSPDGKVLASGGLDNTIRVWHLKTRRPLLPPLPGHKGWILSLAFTPDGKILASGSVDRTIRLWNIKTGRPHGIPFTGHPTSVTTLAFSPDGTRLASGSEDDSVILWDVETRQQLGWPLVGHANSVLGVAFSPDGKTLASASSDATVVLWDISAGHFLAGHTSVVRNVTFSPNGQMIASASSDHTVRLWDPTTYVQIGPTLGNLIEEAVLEPDGHTQTVWSVAFSPDNQTIASGSGDDTIILWDVATGSRRTEPLTGHQGDVLSVAFSPNGQQLASGSDDNTIILWDVETQKKLTTLKGHTGGVAEVTFSPDGKLLASAGDDKTVMIWDVATGQPVGDPLVGHIDKVNSVTFSADGRMLASGSHDTFVILWDVENLTEITRLQGHINRVTSVAFSPDDQTLASGSYDKNILLWNVTTHQLIGPPLIGHTNDVNSVAWSPDGKTLVSGSWDNTLILWNIDFEAWPKRACRIANRNLSQTEWDEFVGPAYAYETLCED